MKFRYWLSKTSIGNLNFSKSFFQNHKKCSYFENFGRMWLVNELVLTFSTSIKYAKYNSIKSCWVYDLLSESELVKFSLIESVICIFTDSPVKKIFLTVKSVNYHWFISGKIFFTVKSVYFHWSNQWNLTDSQ